MTARPSIPWRRRSAAVWLVLLLIASPATPATWADQTEPPTQPQLAVASDPASEADPAERLQSLRHEFNELRSAIHANTADDPAASLRKLLSQVLELVESEPPLPWRAYGSLTALCDETVLLLRRHDNRSATDWQRFHERIGSLIDRHPHATSAPERAINNHAALCRRLLVMLLHLLPAEYAHLHLDQVYTEITGRDKPAELTTWLHDLHSLSPATVMGDALAPAIDPALRNKTERIIFDLLADDRVTYQTRRSVIMSLVGARHSSGQSQAAGRMLDHWMRTHTDQVREDVDLQWRRFNIALFGEADREAAWQRLLALQRLADEAGEKSRAATLTGHASRHYYQLLPLSQMEYERRIFAEEQRYLDRRQNPATASPAAAAP